MSKSIKESLINTFQYIQYIKKQDLIELLNPLTKNPTAFISNALRENGYLQTNKGYIYLNSSQIKEFSDKQPRHKFLIFQSLFNLIYSSASALDKPKINIEKSINSYIQPDITIKNNDLNIYFEADTGFQNKEVIIQKIENYSLLENQDFLCFFVTDKLQERRLIEFPSNFILLSSNDKQFCTIIKDTIISFNSKHKTQNTTQIKEDKKPISSFNLGDISSTQWLEIECFCRQI